MGDLNPESVNRENNSSSNNTQSLFLDLFNNLGLTQLINSSTHRHGNIILTDSSSMTEDLAIADPGCFIQSNHSPITFTIKANAKRLTPVQRSVYKRRLAIAKL